MVGRDPWYEFNTDPVNFPNALNQTFLDNMLAGISKGGATWVRVEFHAEYGNRVGPGYIDWDKYDWFINTSAPAHNLKVLALLNSGIIADTDKTYSILRFNDPPDSPDGTNNYIRAFRDRSKEIADRYGDRIAAYELMNEPNINAELGAVTSWTTQELNPNNFGALLTQTYLAIKVGHPNVPVIMGGLLKGTPVENPSRTTADFLNLVYASPRVQWYRNYGPHYGGELYPFDGVGSHPYPFDTWASPEVVQHLAGLRQKMVYWGDGVNKIWVTEIGKRGEVPSSSSAPASSSEVSQADFMNDVLTAIYNQESSFVARVFWFKYEDFYFSGSGYQSWGVVRLSDNGAGVYARDGSVWRYKPGYLTFQFLAKPPSAGNATNLPVVLNDGYGGWTTGFSLRNTSNLPASLQVSYFSPGGGLLAQENATVPDGGYWSSFQGGSRLPPGFAGSALLSSSQRLVVEVNETKPGVDAMGYTGSTPSAQVFAPVVMDNAYGGWSTGINIRNASTSEPAHVSVLYYDRHGNLVKTDAGSIPLNGSWGVAQAGQLGGDFAGWALLTADQPIVVTVNEVNPSGGSMSYDGMPTASGGVYVPVVMDNAYGGWSTGINIANTSANPANVFIDYYDASGRKVGTDSSTVQGHGYWGVYQGGGRLGAGFAGSAVIRSDQAVVATVNETNQTGTGAMSYAGIPQGATRIFLPVVMDGAYGGWTTGVNIANPGAAAASVTITYYDSQGVARTKETRTISPKGYWGAYQGGKLGNGFAGSAVITSNVPVVAIVNEIHTSGSSISYNGIPSP